MYFRHLTKENSSARLLTCQHPLKTTHANDMIFLIVMDITLNISYAFFMNLEVVMAFFSFQNLLWEIEKQNKTCLKRGQ